MAIEYNDNIDALRNRLLNNSLIGLAVVSLPIVAISISRMMAWGWRPVFALQIVFVASLWIGWLLRDRLPYAWRAGVLLVALAATGLAGYMQIGPVSAGGPLLVLFQLLAFLLLEFKAAFRVAGLVAACFIGVAAAWVYGVFSIDMDYAIFSRDPKNWGVLIGVVICHGGVITYLGWQMFQDLINQHRALQEANGSLEKRSREAEASSKLKTEILRSLSHEFRTPLNGILGMAELLQSSELDDDSRHWLDSLKSSAGDLGGMLDRMLDFVAMTAEGVKLFPGPFAFHELLENITRRTQLRAEPKWLAVSLRIESDVPAAMVTDGQRLQQLLGELLDNAVRFTDKGSIEVHAGMVAPESNDGRQWVQISVTDSGTGIPLDAQQYIFDIFYQVDGSTTRTTGGNGLGLAISKRIAELLGGHIGVESNELGSKFIVTIPVDKPDEEYL